MQFFVIPLSYLIISVTLAKCGISGRPKQLCDSHYYSFEEQRSRHTRQPRFVTQIFYTILYKICNVSICFSWQELLCSLNKYEIVLEISSHTRWNVLWVAFPIFIRQNNYYRPQRSWAKVMFLQASVILSAGGGLWQGDPPGRENPPGRDNSPLAGRTPPQQGEPPGTKHPREADSSIRSTSGWYASYWNAFLLN